MSTGRTVFVLLILALLFPPMAFADLSAFRRDVEREESRNREAPRPQEERRADKPNHNENDNSFGNFLFQITVLAWAAHNGAVVYTGYPYALSSPGYRNFIGYDWNRWERTGDPMRRRSDETRRYWFELAGGGIASDDGSYGGFASLQGRFFPFLGPDADYRIYFDGETQLQLFTVGLDLALIQHDYFLWSIYGKGAFFRGELERNGAAFGTSLRSYIARPVSLVLRFGGISFDAIDFAQFEGRLNLHQDRWFLFGGGNLLQSSSTRLFTVETGIGLVF
ncbi:MAG: hypothetical protein EA403_17015 [Spirochaetaceae bacterium]|nr:MAG: hypothetical protein EA403_17015 [Spirochaetaceae bacterium]